jgi:hypothetical protein
MIMRLDMFSSLVKSKSHPAVTPPARRKYFADYRCNLMGKGVIVPVEFVMDHIVDTGCRYLVPWLEFIRSFHFGLLYLPPVHIFRQNLPLTPTPLPLSPLPREGKRVRG